MFVIEQKNPQIRKMYNSISTPYYSTLLYYIEMKKVLIEKHFNITIMVVLIAQHKN